MSRWILFLASIAWSLPLILMAQQKSSVPKESQRTKNDLLPFQATEKTLPNGLKVIMFPPVPTLPPFRYQSRLVPQ
jgi:hypothetical protein